MAWLPAVNCEINRKRRKHIQFNKTHQLTKHKQNPTQNFSIQNYSKHKFFENLPVNVNMSGVYENIAPTISLRNFKGENIVQTIAFDRIPDGNILKRNYIGSGEVWSGSDLSIVKHNKGKMVLSTLKLVENLNYDPVSEIVLLNIINYFR